MVMVKGDLEYNYESNHVRSMLGLYNVTHDTHSDHARVSIMRECG